MNGHAPEKGYFTATQNSVTGNAPENSILNGYAPEYVHKARQAIILPKLNKNRAKYFTCIKLSNLALFGLINQVFKKNAAVQPTQVQPKTYSISIKSAISTRTTYETSFQQELKSQHPTKSIALRGVVRSG
jgi:hypothetical protein